MMNEVTIYNQDILDKTVRMANMFAKSKIIPVGLRNNVEDVFSILVMGQELGINPMNAINSINVVQGRPCLAGQLMVALVRKQFPNALIDIKLNEADKVATCRTARDAAQEEYAYTATWDMAKASAMGLAGRDQYKKQAMNMLKWRAVTESLRVTFPDVLMGLYAQEEFKDADGKEVTLLTDAEVLDNDFPIPENEKIPGPEYRFKNGKFRGKQMQDVDFSELENYYDLLEDRIQKDGGKNWENEVHQAIGQYFMQMDEIKEIES